MFSTIQMLLGCLLFGWMIGITIAGICSGVYLVLLDYNIEINDIVVAISFVAFIVYYIKWLKRS